MRKLLLLLSVLALSSAYLPDFAEAPRSTRLGLNASLEAVAVQVMPPQDSEALIAEDARLVGPGVPLRVGEPSKVLLSPENSGTWQTLASGDRLWRLRVHSEGALWIGLGFGSFRLPEGAELYVYDPGQTQVQGPFTVRQVKSHGQLWLPPVPGSTAVLELYWPAALGARTPRLTLNSVSHGYRPIFEHFGETTDKASGACNIDINCPLGDAWQDEKRGVTRMLISSRFLCTGSLVGNTANDCRNYFLTANHCLSTETEAASVVFYFGYERADCGAGSGSLSQTLSGSSLVATWDGSDVTLLELDDTPPADYEAYYNGWSRVSTAATESTGIHHPAGDVKKICFNADPLADDPPVTALHWRVTEWEQGTTEGGSSGSPLFDQDSRIVGQLHGGVASCENLSGWDEYGKFDSSWDGGGSAESRLSDWLDPGGTGEMVLDGVDATTCAGPQPELDYEGHTISEPGGDRADIVDPGESIFLEVDVRNGGAAAATAVSGTLNTETPLVTITDGASEWPDVPVAQVAGSLDPHFRFEVDPNYPCGQKIAFTLSMTSAEQSGARVSTFTRAVGNGITTQDFDDDMEGGEGGWSHEELVASNPWALSSTRWHSASHAWTVLDIATVADSVLEMEVIEALAPDAVLSFWHDVDTEANQDGGVLEYSTDGSTWQDAGSLITAGGYNSTLSAIHGSPLGGRDAWSGDSGGWHEVRVDLSSLEGETLHLRWRFATDESLGGVGWNVDDVGLTTTTWVCDNCPTLANPGQEDFDLDGIGDACEDGARLADANNSKRVDGFDLSLLGRSFGAAHGDAAYDARADLNRDGLVDGDDLALMAASFGAGVSDW